MLIIKEEKLREYLESVGSEGVRDALVNLLEEFDPHLYQRPKKKLGRPTKYPFRGLNVNDVVTVEYDSLDELNHARRAAYTVASLHRSKFVYNTAKTDGKFTLTVSRVE